MVAFDDYSKSPYGIITIREEDKKPKIYGNTLSAGTYTIWFENEASIKCKLELVQQFDIKGTGSWSLGDEENNTWNYYKLWLNGCYFNDVQGHWATDYILSTFKKDYMIGMTEDAFKPDEPLTRAQAAVILVRLLGYEHSRDNNESFDDTIGHWAQASIDTARSMGIINGVGNNLFNPEAPITREQMAVMLHNMLKERVESEPVEDSVPVFYDVTQEKNPWSYRAIGIIKQYNIISGFGDNSFKPAQILTRGEMTVLLDKVYQFMGN